MSRLRVSPDLLAGGLFLFAGVVVMLLAAHYPVGDAARMGPGYFPRLLGGLLAGLGLLVSIRAVAATGLSAGRSLVLAWLAVFVFWGLLAGAGRIDLALAVLLVACWPVSRPLFWILASIALFALLLEPLGLAAASLGLVLAARQADPAMNWRAALSLWLLLLIVCVSIFVWGLSIPVSIGPRVWSG